MKIVSLTKEIEDFIEYHLWICLEEFLIFFLKIILESSRRFIVKLVFILFEKDLW